MAKTVIILKNYRDLLRQNTIYRSFNVLLKKEKQKFLLIICAQIFLGLIELLTVALIGAIGAITVSGIANRNIGDRTNYFLEILNINNMETEKIVSILGAGTLFLLIFKTSISLYISKKVFTYLSFKSAKISSQLLNSYFMQSYQYIRQIPSQEIILNLNRGVDSITVGILASLANLVSDVFLLLILVSGLFFIDPGLAISLVLIFSFISIVLYKFFREKMRILGLQDKKNSILGTSILVESLLTYKEIIIKNRTDFFTQKINTFRYSTAQVSSEKFFLPMFSRYVIETSIILGAIATAIIQFNRFDAVRAASTLILFLATTARLAPAVLRIQQFSLSVRASTGFADSTLSTIETIGLHHSSDKHEPEIDFLHSGFTPLIKLVDVSFRYPNKSEFAISEISLEIPHGVKVAIVGPSGAGKSTLADLILGVAEPTTGSITINEVTPREALKKWPGAFGYIPQDITILNGTVRDNVMFGYLFDSKYDPQVNEALEKAQLMEVIENLPLKLDENLNERGSRLSGGQKQRLGIARAIFTKPKILILDEATNELDSETEFKLSNSISNIRIGTTLIVIAHRLTTVLDADLLIYIDNGKIKAMGTFEEVRAHVPNFDKQAGLSGL